MKYEIRVQLKQDVLNVEAKEILSSIYASGFSSVSSLDTVKVFILDVHDDSSEEVVHKIAYEILSNTVIEDFSITKLNV